MSSSTMLVTRCLLAVASVGALISTANAAELRNSQQPISATLLSETTPAGDSYFALALQAARLEATDRPHDHVLLVDTSASQVGEHRQQALAVVEEFRSALPDGDRLLLFAVDVTTRPLQEGFVAKQDGQVDAALVALKRIVPLGATDLTAALRAALDAFEGSQGKSILYVGDGMSTANLLHSDELQGLLRELRDSQIAVHSYAVGPQTDLRLLGSLGQFTGGVVLFDNVDELRDDPAHIGRQLASATHAPIMYPSSIDVPRVSQELLPQVALPLRGDRATVYLGKGTPRDAITISASGDEYAIDLADELTHNGPLEPLYRQATQDAGLSVAFAGLDMLYGAQLAIELTNAQQPPEPEAAPAAAGAQADESDLDPRTGPPTTSLLEREEQRRQINTERLTLQVTRAIEGIQAFAAEEPDGALSDLKRVLNLVDSAPDVEPDVREQLRRRLRGVMQDVRNQREDNEQAQVLALERQAQIETEKVLIEQLEAREERLEYLIERVRALIDDGIHGDDASYSEAEEVARVAVDLKPGSGTAAAALFTSEALVQLNRSFRLRSLRQDRFLETLHQVELSHVPFPDEPPILWPPAEVWKALTERRRQWAAVSIFKESDSEKRIREELNQETDLNIIEGTTLFDAIEFISRRHDIPILPEWDGALADESIDRDLPVELQVTGIPLRSALRLLLNPLQLTYIIQDDVMKITTQIAVEEEEDFLETRIYPVGDLVIPIQSLQGGGGGVGGGVGGGGGGRGGGVGGGAFSIPPFVVPTAPKARSRKADPQPKVRDPEMRRIIDDALDAQTSQSVRPIGQAFAQVVDQLPAQGFRLDNESIEARKKKLS